MKVIGITGGVGAGKTEILKYIGKHYLCRIYLADEVAHQVKRRGTKCFDRLVSLLGEDVLGGDGEIDRQTMARQIFGDEALLEKVNAIVHPAVQAYLTDRRREAQQDGRTELFFVEAALLIEAGYQGWVDELWYVYAGEDVRRTRLQAGRGYDRERIDRIMGSQLSEEEFRRACDFVIDNSGELTDSFRQIDDKLEAFSWRD